MRRWLWIAVLLFAAGDIATTAYGLHTGETEGNPILAEAIGEIGPLPAMVIFKAGACTLAYICQKLMPRAKWVPPAALVTVWGPVTALNTVTLIT